MKFFTKPLLSLAAPLLILVAVIGFFQRKGNDRLQPLPAFLVGTGLIISSAIGRRYRRRKLLEALHRTHKDEG